jgi:hypothetical protein
VNIGPKDVVFLCFYQFFYLADDEVLEVGIQFAKETGDAVELPLRRRVEYRPLAGSWQTHLKIN